MKSFLEFYRNKLQEAKLPKLNKDQRKRIKSGKRARIRNQVGHPSRVWTE